MSFQYAGLFSLNLCLCQVIYSFYILPPKTRASCVFYNRNCFDVLSFGGLTKFPL
uniref:Uncharacterized protein n=1 Tax=Rhizophora mucronata TaxID=61149 RepID=A0A2P2MMG5_RHIMU